MQLDELAHVLMAGPPAETTLGGDAEIIEIFFCGRDAAARAGQVRDRRLGPIQRVAGLPGQAFQLEPVGRGDVGRRDAGRAAHVETEHDRLVGRGGDDDVLEVQDDVGDILIGQREYGPRDPAAGVIDPRVDATEGPQRLVADPVDIGPTRHIRDDRVRRRRRCRPP